MADVTLSSTNCNPPLNMPDSLDGLVLSVPTSALGNADTSYFYFLLVGAGFNIFALDFIILATTLTIEVSNDLLSVPNSSATWYDYTSILTSGSSSITATGSLTVQAPFMWSRIRVKRVTTNATNSLSLRLTRGRVK